MCASTRVTLQTQDIASNLTPAACHVSSSSNSSNSTNTSASKDVDALVELWAAAAWCVLALSAHRTIPEELLSAAAHAVSASPGLPHSTQQQQQLRSCQLRCVLVLGGTADTPSVSQRGSAMSHKDLAGCRALCVEGGGKEAACLSPLLAAALAVTAPQTAQVHVCFVCVRVCTIVQV